MVLVGNCCLQATLRVPLPAQYAQTCIETLARVAKSRRQPQHRPFPLFFCGKEWFKDVGLGRNVHAKPSVSKGKKHVWTWTEGVRIFPRLPFVDHIMFGFDCPFS